MLQENRKKILFLSAWYPTRYDPMPGLFVKRHAGILTGKYNVAVLHAFQVENLPDKYELDISEEDGVFTVIVYYRKPQVSLAIMNYILKPFRFTKSYLKGMKAIRRHYGLPDIIHVNILTRVGVIGWFMKIRYGIPYVITEHWSRYLENRNEYHGWLRKLVTKIIVAQSSGISTVSGKLRESMILRGIRHKNFFIVNNVVDEKLFRPLDVPASQVKIFSHVSCFDDKAKNVTGIVQAIAKLSKTRSDFICLMAGDGPDLKKIMKLSGELGIPESVLKFTGLKEGSDLVEIYNHSLFTVLFSNYENMPVVIPESFACGKPVIATRVGGIPEIINKINGLLTDPGDVDGLASKINFMLDHSQEYDSYKIRELAREQFGPDSVLKQIEKLYSSTIVPFNLSTDCS